MLHISPIPALDDNYFWLLSNDDSPMAYVIDPGDGQAVQQVLTDRQLTLAAIFVTHRHYDHVDGIKYLIQQYQTASQRIPVYGPDSQAIPHVTDPVYHGDHIPLYDNQYHFSVIATPGHTTEHISYFSQHLQTPPVLFCGDTLFAAGCGRLSGGTAIQLHNSLTLLSDLPDATQIYCAHEYTLANLAFAQAVEPHNTSITQRIVRETQKRAQSIPTIPSNILLEKQTNPFMRTHKSTVKTAVEARWDTPYHTEDQVFTHLRLWKDNF
jgi:hydroxyacylglutathione hydrolase